MSGLSLGEAVDRLLADVKARADAPAASSYTASLLARGRGRVAQKLGEEALEAALALVAEDADGLAGEAADLLYHLAVALTAGGVDPAEVANRLTARRGRSGLEEKAGR